MDVFSPRQETTKPKYNTLHQRKGQKKGGQNQKREVVAGGQVVLETTFY